MVMKNTFMAISFIGLSACASSYQWAHWHTKPSIVVEEGADWDLVQKVASDMDEFGPLIKESGYQYTDGKVVRVKCGGSAKAALTALEGHLLLAVVEYRCGADDSEKWLRHELEHALGRTLGEVAIVPAGRE